MAKDKRKPNEPDTEKRILIINNESMYIEELEKTVNTHASGRAKVDSVNIKDAKSKIESEGLPYDGNKK